MPRQARTHGQRQVHKKVVTIPIPGGTANIDAADTEGTASVCRVGDLILGPENRTVFSAVQALLSATTPWGQVVLFYGPCGCGKSSLAHGLVTLWKQRQSRRSAKYVAATDFARELAEAIDTKTADEFRLRYRRLTLLAVDDVQLLRGRIAAQEELARTFDVLVDGGASVVMTATAAPERLDGLIPHLQSRLVAGLAVPVVLPGVDTRRHILRVLASRRHLVLPDDVLEALTDGLRGGIPALVGALVRLEAAAQMDGQPITVETVRRVLKARGSRARPSIAEIATAAAKYFSLQVRDLRGPSRRQAIVTARDVAMYLARTVTRASFHQIGQYFAGRDHTTVAHACRKTERLLASDGLVRSAVDHLRERLEYDSP